MTPQHALIKNDNSPLVLPSLPLPSIIESEDEKTKTRFVEFFAVNIRNEHTRHAYMRAVGAFLVWCEGQNIGLKQIQPLHVAAYVEQLQDSHSAPTVKQNLAAIRMLFDWLVVGQIIPFNPASSVKSPRYLIKKGKTPVLSAVDCRMLLDSIDTRHVVGLRDRALIGLMVFSFARVGAVIGMKVKDYYQNGKRYWLRLHEKGGKFHELPVHHLAEEYLDAYIEAAGIAGEKNKPLFRTSIGRTRELTENEMSRQDVWYMVRRRAKDAGISAAICCHTFRATGITEYLRNDGTLERAAQIAGHESTRTTQLYNRLDDTINLDEIERIRI
jgi:site-specific recombinase XerD